MVELKNSFFQFGYKLTGYKLQVKIPYTRHNC